MSWRWPQLRRLIPEGKRGNAHIVHFSMSKQSSKTTMLRSIIKHDPTLYCKPGKYIKLVVNGGVMMSDTDMEKNSNRQVVARAHGSVLVGGLGLGLATLAMCRKREVREVVVIENNPDVVTLVEPYIRHKKLTVVRGDIFGWTPSDGKKFDIIWFDIWATICIDNLEEIARLHQRFKFKLNRENPRCWMSSWKVEELRYQRDAARF